MGCDFAEKYIHTNLLLLRLYAFKSMFIIESSLIKIVISQINKVNSPIRIVISQTSKDYLLIESGFSLIILEKRILFGNKCCNFVNF